MDKQLNFITKQLIEQAANNINLDDIPKNREGKSYAVTINGIEYPFKYLITEAAKLAGIELTPQDFGNNANNRKGFEEATGYKCIRKVSLFYDIIQELKALLHECDSVLRNFKIHNVEIDSTWVWISDHVNKIGEENCHYEIRKINQTIYVEVHFEGTSANKQKFYNDIGDLPAELSWFKWKNYKSLRYKDGIDINDDDIAESIKEELLYIENSLGDKLRNIMDSNGNNSKPNKELISFPLNQILYGPPGTGKTYNSVKEAVRIANPDFDINQDWNTIKIEYDRLVEEKQIVFTTFHQSMNYEDFVEGIKPQEPKEEGQSVTYKIEDGIFKQIFTDISFMQIIFKLTLWRMRVVTK
nr:hypothetical protein [uncultured Carboxylicivirga sp.]